MVGVNFGLTGRVGLPTLCSFGPDWPGDVLHSRRSCGVLLLAGAERNFFSGGLP